MINETQLNRAIVAHYLRKGTLAIKVSDRFHAGIPDIYVAGGKWIEGKHVNCKVYFTPSKLLRPDQVRWMNKLWDGNDAPYIVVLVNKNKFWAGRWNIDDCDSKVSIDRCWDNLELCLSERIG